MYPLFLLYIAEFDATAPLRYQTYWQRFWFPNIPTERKREGSNQVSLEATKLELHVGDQTKVQDNFRTATDATSGPKYGGAPSC
jgi:hypothetical protein